MPTKTIFGLLLLLLSTPVFGQAPPTGSLTGEVRDSLRNEALPSATVAIFGGDGGFVTGTATGENGEFKIDLTPGIYGVRVSFVGYKTWERNDVEVSPGSANALAPILLAEAATLAGEAEVIAERELVEQRADRTVYNVAAQPVTSGGSAIETLQTLPSIEVDTDGNVSLRGSQNVAIHVNGRPVPVSGSMLTTMLRQIPASNIERVEVMANPSAKYEPDGMSGIINIVMKQGADRGLAGGLTVGGGTSPGAEISGNLSYQKGKVDVYGSYGYRYDSFGLDGSSSRVSFAGGAASAVDQGLEIRTGSGSHLLSGTLDYSLTGTANVGFSGTLGRSDGDLGFFTTFHFNPDIPAASYMERDSDGTSNGYNADGSINFAQRFDGDAHKLTAEARLTRNADERTEDFLERMLVPSSTDALSRSLSDDLVDETAVQTDYVRPLAGLRVETGGKFTRRSAQNDRVFEHLAASGPTLDPGRSNEYTYGEDVLAGYLQAGRSIGAVEMQLGLRAETATRDFSLSQTAEDFGERYQSLYPSAFLQYTKSQGTLAKISYSRRINRPKVAFLDPTPQFEDTLLVDRGNPHLKPEYTDAFELTLQYKFVATITPFYRRTTDVIRRRILFDPATGVSTGTFQNLDSQDTYGADLTLMPKIGPVRGVLSASAYRSITDGGRIENGLASDGFVWSLRGNLQAQVRKGMHLQLFGFYRGALEVEDGRISPFGIMSLGLSQQLASDRLRLAVRVNDLLGTAEFNFRTGNEHYSLIGLRSPDIQQVSATLTYTFGKPGKPRQPRPTEQQGSMDGAGGMGF